MSFQEGRQLAEFSEAVRQSTIQKLESVREGDENWRPRFGTMTFADLARHLIDCDRWLFEKLKNPNLRSIRGKPGVGRVESRKEYLKVLKELKKVGTLRVTLLKHLTTEDLSRYIFDDRYCAKISVWWLIVRGNLDHEIHHRGQIALYLKLASDHRHDSVD